MSHKTIILIVVIALAACGVFSACGLGLIFLSSLDVSPAGQAIDSPASVGEFPEGPSDAPSLEGIAALSPTRDAPPSDGVGWEDLLALSPDDPALAELDWLSSGSAVLHYAAGYTLDFDRAGRVTQLTLYAGHDTKRFAQYAGELPYGLVWGDTINSVASKLPQPDSIGPGLRQSWDEGSLGPHAIELSFYDGMPHDDLGETLLSAVFVFPQ